MLLGFKERANQALKKIKQELVCGLGVCSRVLNFNLIFDNTSNIPEDISAVHGIPKSTVQY